MTTPATDGPRGEQTRRRIVDTAVRLFQEQGYDKTTMRAIAQAAGLSVGNAYYYFPSKTHLVQEFYAGVQREHLARSAPVLASRKDFAGRLHGVLAAAVEVMSPYHAFAGPFFKVAADPDSPLSPFSAESRPAREISRSIFGELVTGTTTKIDAELVEDLPELLWLVQLGITLFWVHDRSPGQRKTRLLVDGVVPLIDRLMGLSRLKITRPVIRELLSLYKALRD